MKKKRYLFICSTQFTIFNSINIVLNDPEKYSGKTDIVLFHQTQETKKLLKKLEDAKIFNTIYNFPFINNIHSIFLLILFIFPRFVLNRICLNKESINFKKHRYEEIYAQNILYASLFKRFNKKTSTYLIEEGLSSYTGRALDARRRRPIFRFANKTFLRHFFIADIKGQLLYRPELYLGNKGYETYLQITPPKHSTTLNKIFQYKTNELFSYHKFIYLGAPYWGLRRLIANPNLAKKPDINLEVKCKSIVDQAMMALRSSSFIYRMHPLEEIDHSFYEQFCKLDEYQNMWEIECQHSLNNDHILMSFFSTASFTPKLLYDKEPYLIFLNNLTGHEFLNMNIFVDGLKTLYRNPKKIMQPKSEEELLQIIDKLSRDKN